MWKSSPETLYNDYHNNLQLRLLSISTNTDVVTSFSFWTFCSVVWKQTENSRRRPRPSWWVAARLSQKRFHPWGFRTRFHKSSWAQSSVRWSFFTNNHRTTAYLSIKWEPAAGAAWDGPTCWSLQWTTSRPWTQTPLSPESSGPSGWTA